MGGAIFLVLLALILASMALVSVAAIAKSMRMQMTSLDERVSRLGARLDRAAEEAQQAATAGDEDVRSDLATKLEEAQRGLREAIDESRDRLNERAAAAEDRLAKTEQGVQTCREAVGRAEASLTENIQTVAADLNQALSAAETRAAEQAQSHTDRLDALDTYVKDTLNERLDSAMRAFNGTVTGVLGEMKGELLRGVGRIEDMEAVVAGRAQAQERLLSGPDRALQEPVGSTPEDMESNTKEGAQQHEGEQPPASDEPHGEEQ